MGSVTEEDVTEREIMKAIAQAFEEESETLIPLSPPLSQSPLSTHYAQYKVSESICNAVEEGARGLTAVLEEEDWEILSPGEELERGEERMKSGRKGWVARLYREV